MTRATLLFLGASVSQLPAIRYALDAGYRVAAADGEATAPGLALAHASTAIDFSDIERVAQWAESIRVDGVLAISTDRGVVPAAAIATKLGLPGIGTDVARAMTDKPRMARPSRRAAFAAAAPRRTNRGGARAGARRATPAGRHEAGRLRRPARRVPHRGSRRRGSPPGGVALVLVRRRGDRGGVRRGN